MNCQSESVIIVRETSGDPLGDLETFQYGFPSLCETFCLAVLNSLPIYVYPITTVTQFNIINIE